MGEDFTIVFFLLPIEIRANLSGMMEDSAAFPNVRDIIYLFHIPTLNVVKTLAC